MTFEEWWKQYFKPGSEGSMGTPYGYARAAYQAATERAAGIVSNLNRSYTYDEIAQKIREQ